MKKYRHRQLYGKVVFDFYFLLRVTNILYIAVVIYGDRSLYIWDIHDGYKVIAQNNYIPFSISTSAVIQC